MSLKPLDSDSSSSTIMSSNFTAYYLTKEEKLIKWQQMLEQHPTGLYPIGSPETKTFLGIYEELTVPERNENNEVPSLFFALQDNRMTNEILVKHIEKQYTYGPDNLYTREQYNPHCRDLVLYEIDVTLCPLKDVYEIKKYLQHLYKYPKNTRLFPGVIVIDKPL